MEDVAGARAAGPQAWLPPALWAAGIFAASSLPGRLLPAVGLFAYDKLLHAGAFGGLAALVTRAVLSGPRARRGGGRAFVWAVAVGLGYGALDELHQRSVAGRSPDVRDLVADVVGAILGAGLYLAVRREVRRGADSTVFGQASRDRSDGLPGGQRDRRR